MNNIVQRIRAKCNNVLQRIKRRDNNSGDDWVKTIFLIIVICSVVIGATHIILWIPNEFINPNDDWISFWGSISGSIIGAVITIIALQKTIEYERKKEKSTQRLNILPVFSYKIVDDREVETEITFNLAKEEETINIELISTTIELENIGMAYCPQLVLINFHIVGGSIESQYRVSPYEFWNINKEEKVYFKLNLLVEKNVSDRNILTHTSIGIVYTNLFQDCYEQNITLEIKQGKGGAIHKQLSCIGGAVIREGYSIYKRISFHLEIEEDADSL